MNRLPTPFHPVARLAVASFIVLSGAIAGPLAGQGCPADGSCSFDACRTPALGQDSALWGELEPGTPGIYPADRDTTDFDQVGDFEPNPYWISLDVEEGWVFAVAGRRFQIWNANSQPANPVAVWDKGFRDLGLEWTPDAHAFYIFEDIDSPPGNSNVTALVGRYGVGMAVYKTTDKTAPVLLYQDHGNGRVASQVYAAHIGERDYAFVGADLQGSGGLFAYDLTAAAALGSRCTEAQPAASSACPGVFLRKIGTRAAATSVDGAGSFLVVASGLASKGFEIWNVAAPSNPTLVMTGLTSDPLYGVALWQEGASYYLAVRSLSLGRIYNVSCIAQGSCSLGSALWSGTFPNSSDTTVTFSRSESTPFLYFGVKVDCITGNQQEFLYDVSAPASPRDITPPGTQIVSGQAVGYWGWFYRRNGIFGFNRVQPRMGKFYGRYFYRAAHSVFDIHKWNAPSTPVADFDWTPVEVYPNTAIAFDDQSTGVPSDWDWDFLPDGSPGSSAQQNPSGIQFPTTGAKTIRLTASNFNGSDMAQKTLTVLNPAPTVASVGATPNPALLCQPVTFTAQGVKGQPPRTFSWVVRENGGPTVDTGGNVNPFVWTSLPAASTAVTYVAEVTVSTQSAGSAVKTSSTVALQSPAPLPTSGSFSPTYDGQPSPPASGTVQFHVTASGATEWNWDFGDGNGYSGWTSNPVAGPNPLHTYSSPGSFGVRVKVRNCVEAEKESAQLPLSVPDTTPLVAEFSTNLFCISGVCSADLNQGINITDRSVGAPDFWDYDWDGDGTFEDAGNAVPRPSHTYSVAGHYYPRLRVRRGPTQDFYEDHLPINVGGVTPQPRIIVSGPALGPTGQSQAFTASMKDCRVFEGGWSWSASGGAQGSSQTPTISLTWTATGPQTLTVSNSACPGIVGTKAVEIVSGALIFDDGFENGTTGQWSLSVP